MLKTINERGNVLAIIRFHVNEY